MSMSEWELIQLIDRSVLWRREIERIRADESIHKIASQKSILSTRCLWTAAYFGIDDWVQEFIDCNFDLWVCDQEHGLTALHFASLMGRTNTVEALVNATGILVNREDEPTFKYEWISMAVLNGRLDLVKYLLDVHLVGARHCVFASQKGNVPMLKLLREVMETDSMSYTRGLQAACKNGHLVAVKYLIENGADPWARDEDGCDAFRLARQSRNDQVLLELLNYTTKDETPQMLAEKLMYAIYCGDVDRVKALVALGAIHGSPSDNESPLYRAARLDYPEICSILLRSGLRPDSFTHRACAQRISERLRCFSYPIIKLFVEHGLEVNPSGKIVAPLTQLAVKGSKFIQLLLEAGANPNGSNVGRFLLPLRRFAIASDAGRTVFSIGFIDFIGTIGIARRSRLLYGWSTATAGSGCKSQRALKGVSAELGH
eukprot:TRINITY_DN11547_c0_g2_i2.p1 TRINITY_DN11547_c0_g2~~TRINITY_DN11547_c0_g2_i2.p1  ORF type:complete len:430 (+),score=30.18 TRINITY_DN11547_c0_g2_i2:24-1313(+)